MNNILQNKIQEAKDSVEYNAYIFVLEYIFDMILEMNKREKKPSDYWSEQNTIFEYMLDASPLIVKKLRHHCSHLTGVHPYEYGMHHIRHKKGLKERYDLLKNSDSNNLFVPESTKLGGFGFEDKGLIYNVDTLKYYECLLVLEKIGFLKDFLEYKSKNIVLEIGGGWGGLAYQFKTLFPKTTYVIIDLPQVLLFSAINLIVNFPQANILIYKNKEDAIIDKKYDFILMPHYSLQELNGPIDLALNTVSFQEMSKMQVEDYCKKLHQLGCLKLYSYNKPQNLNNLELGNLTEILNKYFELNLFESSFLQHMRSTMVDSKLNRIKKYLRKNRLTRNIYKLLKQLIRGADPEIDTSYKHYYGTRVNI